MQAIRKKIEDEVDTLTNEAVELITQMQKYKSLAGYQKWYTRALAVVNHLLPDRLDEFIGLYKGNEKDNSEQGYAIRKYLLYITITDRLNRPKFDHESLVLHQLSQQFQILNSARTRINNVFHNIKGILEAQLFDSELDAARELSKNGHYRAAGAIVGVVLESHLSTVAKNHNLTSPKKDPHISDWNELLKQASLIDIPTWRKIQHIADIRNLCTHKKNREPKKEEVEEIIEGVDRIIKTLT